LSFYHLIYLVIGLISDIFGRQYLKRNGLFKVTKNEIKNKYSACEKENLSLLLITAGSSKLFTNTNISEGAERQANG
jgi:hypothetical protein